MSGTFFLYNRDHPYFPYHIYNGNDPEQKLFKSDIHSDYTKLHDFYYYPHDHHFIDNFGYDYGSYSPGYVTPYIYRKSEYNQDYRKPDIFCRPHGLHFKY